MEVILIIIADGDLYIVTPITAVNAEDAQRILASEVLFVALNMHH